MSGNNYSQIRTNSDYDYYEFISEGKQPLNKVVTFGLIEEKEQIYNLALGTILTNGEFDYTTPSRNGDMNAVLETVANIVKIFSDKYPQRKIFLMGSDLLRTRQYQIKITVFYKLIIEFFEIEGVIMNGFEIKQREKFKNGTNYEAFILTRK